VKAAVVQLNSGEDVGRNLSTAEALGREAATAGAALVVMPENALYMGAEEGRGQVAGRYVPGEAPGGPCGERMAALSRETGAWVLWGGVPEARAEDARTFNTAALLDERGVVVARYRKIHLFDIDLPGGPVLTESRNTAPGDALVVADTPVGRLGLSVCYDVRFPELYRGLVDGGATVLAVPAAFTATTGRAHWELLLRARAVESQSYVLAAAQWGTHPGGRTTWGHAMIVDPWGVVLAERAEGEGVVLAEIDPGRTASVRASLPSLMHRRIGRSRSEG
jgi:predicted amidohydrolase